MFLKLTLKIFIKNSQIINENTILNIFYVLLCLTQHKNNITGKKIHILKFLKTILISLNIIIIKITKF